MKTLTLLITFFVVTSSYAADLGEIEVRMLLIHWLESQNTQSFEKYHKMYSHKFSGVRRSRNQMRTMSYEAWMQERKKMFEHGFQVQALNPEIETAEEKATIKFVQMWSSRRYNDIGNKIIEIRKENKELRIINEAMLDSESYKDYESRDPLGHLVTNSKAAMDTFLIQRTSVSDEVCKTVPEKQLVIFQSDSTMQCPSIKGWSLYKEYDWEGLRSWLRLLHDGALYTTKDIVYGDQAIGHFPFVESPQVEWLLRENGEPIGLIFRVMAQSEESVSILLTRYYVIDFMNAVPYFCGTAKTIEEARSIAGKPTSCTQLKKKEI